MASDLEFMDESITGSPFSSVYDHFKDNKGATRVRSLAMCVVVVRSVKPDYIIYWHKFVGSVNLKGEGNR